MKDSRFRALMRGMGMPESRSLLITLQQVANEVEQEVRAEITEKNNKKLKMDAVCPKCKKSVKVIDGWASCVCGATYYTTGL